MSNDPPRQIRFRNIGGVAVVGFPTPYLQAEDAIEKAGAELIDLVEGRGFAKVVVSFDGVRFVSSSMLAQLVKLHRRVSKANGVLRLCCLNPALLEVLRHSHLDRLFEIHENEAAAMQKL
jgi:anti-sigma B factor antagonist